MATANTSATKLLNTAEGTKAAVEKLIEMVTVQNASLEVKLDKLMLVVAEQKKPKPRATAKAGSAAASATAKFPDTSLAWLKDLWRNDRAATAKKYFSLKQLTDSAAVIAKDTKTSTMEGDAKLMAEFAYLWKTYVSNSDALKEKIKKDYNIKKAEHAKASKTAATKEAPPAESAEEPAEEAEPEPEPVDEAEPVEDEEPAED
jgi:hypothetical protein